MIPSHILFIELARQGTQAMFDATVNTPANASGSSSTPYSGYSNV